MQLTRDPNKLQFAHVKVRELMAKIPAELYNRIRWVSTIFRDIITFADEEGFGLTDRPPPSREPDLAGSPEPAPDAGPEQEPAVDFVAGIGSLLRKRWRMDEFHITLERLREAEGFKLTVWAATQQVQMRLREHEDRLRHLYNLNYLGHESEFRDRVQREVLGIGGYTIDH